MKPIHRKLIFATLGGIIFVAIILAGLDLILSRAFDDHCIDTVISTIDSPDHRHTATLYERNCGATTDYVTHVNLQPKYTGTFDPEKGSRILTLEGRHEVKLTWLANDSLKLAYPFIDVFRNEATWQDVKVTHAQIPVQ